jgi:hypothetical protein
MRTSKFLAAVAAVSLLAAPAMAGSASKLSLGGSDVRASKALTNASNQDGDSSGLFIAAGAVAAVVLAVVLISGDDEEDLPTSP